MILIMYIRVAAKKGIFLMAVQYNCTFCLSSPSTKTYIFLADKGFAPPPLKDISAKNASFFWTAPRSTISE